MQPASVNTDAGNCGLEVTPSDVTWESGRSLSRAKDVRSAIDLSRLVARVSEAGPKDILRYQELTCGPEKCRASDELIGSCLQVFKDHAHIVQAGDEAAAVDLLATARTVTEADDFGPVLTKANGEGKSFRVERERDESHLTIKVVPHEYGQFPAWLEGSGTVANELAITAKKIF